MLVGEFKEDVRITIPTIVARLKDSDPDVCKAAIELLSRLAVQGMCYYHFPISVLKPVCS